MKIEVLQGNDSRLYALVAPLVMSPRVLRQNNNVAFKTTPKHTWILAVEKGECIGFLPLQCKKTRGEVNNYHVRNHNNTLFKKLLDRAERYTRDNDIGELAVITQVPQYEVLEANGYEIEKAYVRNRRYVKTP